MQPPVPSTKNLWDSFRASPAFPIASIVLVAVVVIGIGYGVVRLVNTFENRAQFPPVVGPQNVEYQAGGEAKLLLTVSRAAYQDAYNQAKPLAPGRKFVVVNLEIRNDGKGASGPFTREDLRLITPDGSIMPPATWSSGFLESGVGAGRSVKGDVIFDIDERNAQKPLSEFQIAFGKSVGSRALYPLKAE